MPTRLCDVLSSPSGEIQVMNRLVSDIQWMQWLGPQWVGTAAWRPQRAYVANDLGDDARLDRANRLDGSFPGTAVKGRG